ncbi:MAG: hypothetical protein ABR508_07325 [Candidatus Baltobacteraceae bacterium]
MLAAVERITGSCGPLDLSISAADGELAAVACNYVSLFSRTWRERTRRVEVHLERRALGVRASGTFVSCAHMTVDRTGDSYVADTQYGFVARGSTVAGTDVWTISVPPETVFDEPQVGDMEDVFSLICTAGWRNEGFVALHAGAVVKGDVCALLCAASGGGKSTLTTALVLNGWSTLGDDKLLLRNEGGKPVLRSLLQTFNLDPATGRWFDLRDLASLPRYSAWTDKRRVHLDRVRPGAARPHARPTHIVEVARTAAHAGIRSAPMTVSQSAAALLRQIVLPCDAPVARWTLTQTMAALRGMRGVRLEIGQDAYRSSGWLAGIEDALR